MTAVSNVQDFRMLVLSNAETISVCDGGEGRDDLEMTLGKVYLNASHALSLRNVLESLLKC